MYKYKNAALGLVVPVGLLLVWEVFFHLDLINQLFFPAPSQIIVRGLERIIDGTLIYDFLATILRLTSGFLLGGVIGYSAGIIMGLNNLISNLLEPFLSILYTVPKIVFYPVFLIVFGLGELPKIIMISLTVFFYVWVNTMGSIKNIPREYIAICQSITDKKWSLFKNVILPASAPAVFTGLRIGIAVATIITISIEFVTGDSGLGYLIYNSRLLFRYEDAYLGIFVVGTLGYSLQQSIKYLGKKLMPWNPTTDSVVQTTNRQETK